MYNFLLLCSYSVFVVVVVVVVVFLETSSGQETDLNTVA